LYVPWRGSANRVGWEVGEPAPGCSRRQLGCVRRSLPIDIQAVARGAHDLLASGKWGTAAMTLPVACHDMEVDALGPADIEIQAGTKQIHAYREIAVLTGSCHRGPQVHWDVGRQGKGRSALLTDDHWGR